jgi:hypothetical protein
VLRWAILLAASLVWPAATGAQTASPPLMLDGKIRLGQVSGRIDHLGIDHKRKRLLVAELGNNNLGVVDLSAHLLPVLHRRWGPMIRHLLCLPPNSTMAEAAASSWATVGPV